MIKIVFKNLERSVLTKNVVFGRLEPVVERFPDLKSHRIVVTLSMENSPHLPGPDLFTVKLHIQGKRYKNIILGKDSPNLYVALADVVDHTLERLNRYGDRMRMRNLRMERQLLRENDAQAD